ncbi:MAG: helix-turn-helix transcriptional regulator [Cyclobacteriaceae bacterium]
MNNFSDNIKYLRQKESLTMEVFARLFGLKKSTVNAYENGGNLPKLEKYFEITSHFKLDPVKFFHKDMKVHNVYLDQNVSTDLLSADHAKKAEELVGVLVADERFYGLLDGFEDQELKQRVVKLSDVNRELFKENLTLKARLLELLDRKGDNK